LGAKYKKYKAHGLHSQYKALITHVDIKHEKESVNLKALKLITLLHDAENERIKRCNEACIKLGI